MAITDSVLKEDIEILFKDFDFNSFKDKKILVTGSTGLIGRQIVLALLKAGTQVLALVRNEVKAQKLLGEADNLKILVQDIKHPINYEGEIDYIIHTASVTASKDFVNKPVETIFTTLKGMENILEFAKDKKITSMVYLSSLEVYGINNLENKLITENDFGCLNPTEIRSSYSESKRMAECIAVSYGSEYGVPVKIARLAQTFGAGVEYKDNRVFAYFCRSVIENKPIILHTDGATMRNYCYTRDAVNAILTILLKGTNNEAYNVANSDIYLSIKEIAELLVNKYPNISLKFEIDDKDYGFNPTVKINLDTSKLKALNWRAKVGIEQMFERTLLSLKERIN